VLHRSGAEILHHDVGGGHHLAGALLVGGIGEVQHHRSLVAVDRVEIRCHALGIVGRTPFAGIVADLRAFNLYDVGTEVAEHHGGVRAGQDAAEIHHDETVQGTGFHTRADPPRIYTVVVWVKNSLAAPPCSFGPRALFLAPPNGTCGSAPADSELMCRTPTSICSTACSTRVR